MFEEPEFHAFRRRFVLEFAPARATGFQQVVEAVERYIRTGYQAGCISEELTDWFCVDTPSILDDAGYSERAQEEAVKSYDLIHDRIRKELSAS